MSIDALTLSALRAELEENVRGCRIQKIIPTGPLSVVLEVYNAARKQRVQFLLSADAQNARVHLLSEKASQMPGEPTPFLLLLRKYIRYGIITTIEQTPFERILTFTIAKKFPVGKRPQFDAANAAPTSRDDDDDEELTDENAEDLEIYESRLICEIMGRHSNIMLLSEDNIIIDVIKRVAPSKNRYRLILPHQRYVDPPTQEKIIFHSESPSSFARRMDNLRDAQPKAQLWQTLVNTYTAISPQIAREIAYRLAERKGQKLEDTTLDSFQRWDSLYGDLRALLAPLNPNQINRSDELTAASIVRDESDDILAFAPYELRQFQQQGYTAEPIDSISRAAELYYSQAEAVGGQAQRKQEIAAKVSVHYESLRRKANAMEGSIKKAESAEELKRKGEAIYAHLYEIEPGMTELVADGLKIKLDPDSTPSENAQAYFRQYDKARQAMAGVPELLAEVRQTLEYLDEMLTQLEMAENYDEVMYIKGELDEAGFGSKDKNAGKGGKKAKRRLPQTPTYTSTDGFTIYVGKSGQHNDYVTFELGDKNDMWLHARGVPGSHVIIKTLGKDVPDQTLLEAAQLAAYYSKNRSNTKAEVLYAPQRYIRKVKGPHPGLVTYSNDKSINVAPKKLNLAKK